MLLSLILSFIPANRFFSLDALRNRTKKPDTVPAWCLWLLRAQIAIVYIYAGIAKISPNWLKGEPLKYWMAEHSHLPILGPLMHEHWMVLLFSYGSLFFDLFIAPLILWKRSRPWAIALVLFFHITNSQIFHIGIFPWMMIAATTLLFPPDWPRQVFRFFKRLSLPPKPIPVAAGVLNAKEKKILAVMAVALIFQLVIPLRHWLYPGRALYTYEGHRFSWRMLVHERRFGDFGILATDAAKKRSVWVQPLNYLNPKQVAEMGVHPDMILQFAHFIGREMLGKGFEKPEVRAYVTLSINRARPKLLIDPTVDLSKQPRNLWTAPWIIPENSTQRQAKAMAFRKLIPQTAMLSPKKWQVLKKRVLPP